MEYIENLDPLVFRQIVVGLSLLNDNDAMERRRALGNSYNMMLAAGVQVVDKPLT